MAVANTLKDEYIRRSTLTGTQRSVLVTLKSRMGNSDRCYVGITDLADSTGYHPETVRRELVKIEAAGWINIRHRYTESKKGNMVRTTSEYVLLEKNFRGDYQKPRRTSQQETATPPCDIQPPSLSETATLPVLDSIKKKNLEQHQDKNQDKNQHPKKPGAKHHPWVEGVGEYHPTKKKTPGADMNVQEAMKLGVSKGKTTPKKITTAVLSMEYKSAMSILYPEEMVKNLPEKAQHSLRHFITSVGTESLAVFKFILSDWVGYSMHVRDMCGHTTTPQRPSIPYIVKYCAEAYNFYKESTKPVVKKVNISAMPAVAEKKVVSHISFDD